jgi:hypothetical protein
MAVETVCRPESAVVCGVPMHSGFLSRPLHVPGTCLERQQTSTRQVGGRPHHQSVFAPTDHVHHLGQQRVPHARTCTPRWLCVVVGVSVCLCVCVSVCVCGLYVHAGMMCIWSMGWEGGVMCALLVACFHMAYVRARVLVFMCVCVCVCVCVYEHMTVCLCVSIHVCEHQRGA